MSVGMQQTLLKLISEGYYSYLLPKFSFENSNAYSCEVKNY